MSDRMEFELKGPLMEVERFGVLIGDKACSYSKSYTKERFSEEHMGAKVRVKVHNHQGTLYIMDVLEPAMAKASKESAATGKGSNQRGGSWSPTGANGRGRMSTEEIQLEKEKGERIARSSALTLAIQSSQAGSSVEEILKKAQPFAEFIQRDIAPKDVPPAKPEATSAPASQSDAAAPPPAPAPTKPVAASGGGGGGGKLPPTVKAAGDARVPDALVSALWNRAKERRWSWTQFENVCRRVTGGKLPRVLTLAEFQKFTMEVDAALKAA